MCFLSSIVHVLILRLFLPLIFSVFLPFPPSILLSVLPLRQPFFHQSIQLPSLYISLSSINLSNCLPFTSAFLPSVFSLTLTSNPTPTHNLNLCVRHYYYYYYYYLLFFLQSFLLISLRVSSLFRQPSCRLSSLHVSLSSISLSSCPPFTSAFLPSVYPVALPLHQPFFHQSIQLSSLYISLSSISLSSCSSFTSADLPSVLFADA